MSKITAVVCDLCSKPANSDDSGEIVLRGGRWAIDICDDCAGPLLEKLERLTDIQCPECDRTFPKKHGLAIHRRLAHNVLTPNSK